MAESDPQIGYLILTKFEKKLKEGSGKIGLDGKIAKAEYEHQPVLLNAAHIVAIEKVTVVDKADKMSMANSVELRPPFLDHDLVNFMFRIPDKFKIKALKEKHVLKESMKGFLPDSICNRRKQPLQPPGRWFIDSALEMIKDYLSEGFVRQKGYFNPGFINMALQEYENGGGIDYSGVIIVVFFVHLWDEIFLN